MVSPNEFDLAVSITDLIFLPDENYDDVEIREEFRLIIDYLGIIIDIPELYYFYFKNINGEQGDIYINRSKKNENNIIIIDLYKDKFDQIDLITVAIRCDITKSEKLHGMVSNFFNTSEFKISYCCSAKSSRISRLLNEPLTETPLSDLDSFYKMRKRHISIC